MSVDNDELTLSNPWEFLTTGGVYKATTVEEEPSVTLSRWSIKYMKEGQFFVGDTPGGGGRVSTDIVELDLENKRGRTASGRVYGLVGDSTPPSRDAEYVWNYFKRVNRLTELENTVKD